MMWEWWPEEYTAGLLGLWAWDPKKFAWEKARVCIYSYVFGKDSVSSARDFDESLKKLKSYFLLPVFGTKPIKFWPCRLKKLKYRIKALKLINNKKMAMLKYPEYDFKDFKEKILNLIYEKKIKEAEKYFQTAKRKILPSLEKISKELKDLKNIDEYVSTWKRKLSNFEFWMEYSEKELIKMRNRFSCVFKKNFDNFLKAFDYFPKEKIIFKLSSKEWLKKQPRWKGAWGIGSY